LLRASIVGLRAGTNILSDPWDPPNRLMFFAFSSPQRDLKDRENKSLLVTSEVIRIR
jgi:hypothetical protein